MSFGQSMIEFFIAPGVVADLVHNANPAEQALMDNLGWAFLFFMLTIVVFLGSYAYVYYKGKQEIHKRD